MIIGLFRIRFAHLCLCLSLPFSPNLSTFKSQPTQDTQKTIEKYKSGLIPPDDFPMQDLDDPNSIGPDPDTVSITSVSSVNGGPAKGFDKKKKGKARFLPRKKVSTFESLCQGEESKHDKTLSFSFNDYNQHHSKQMAA